MNSNSLAGSGDEILFLGLDIGIKRDTAAVVVTFHLPEEDIYGLWGHHIWKPPVNIVTQVEPLLFALLEQERVSGLLFDPYQFQTTAQRLEERGYDHLLVEVNQQTEMVNAANTLHSLAHEGRFLMYPDAELRSHFAHAAAQQTERGWRIVKKKQSQHIDGVVACAMSVMGVTSGAGFAHHPSFSLPTHAPSILDLV